MFTWIDKLGDIGVIKDVAPSGLPINAWTTGENVLFREGAAERAGGEEAIYNISVSAVTVTQSLAVQPWWALPIQYDANYYWIYAGASKAYVASPIANQNNITRQSATSTASIDTSSPDADYSATVAIRWNGAVLGGLGIVNNGVQPPQVWNPSAVTNRLVELDWDKSDSTKWSTRTAGAVSARVFRTYREYGIALYTTESATVYPRRLRWSHPALPGATPHTWDDSKLTHDAGYKDFDETDDLLVDCKPLGDINIVYKERTAWAMQYVGGSYVHQFQRAFDHIGLLATDCVQAHEGSHIVVTQSDIVLHNGVSAESILKGRIQRDLFDQISQAYYYGCFTLLDTQNYQFWFCYPRNDASDSFCTHAAIWDIKGNTWTFRSLRRASFGAVGPVGSSAGLVDLAWSSQLGSWEDDGGNWIEPSFSNYRRELVLSLAEDSSLVRVNSSWSASGYPYTARLERQGLALAGQTKLAFVRQLRLVTDGAEGNTFRVYIRARFSEGQAVNWRGPYTWTIGSSRKIDLFLTGRFFDVRFETDDPGAARLLAYGFDFSEAGLL